MTEARGPGAAGGGQGRCGRAGGLAAAAAQARSAGGTALLFHDLVWIK